MVNQQETTAEHTAAIEKLAARAFEHHRLRRTDDAKTFTCRTDDSVFYSFAIHFERGMVVVWGDLGEFVIRYNSSDDPVQWMLSVPSLEYLVRKVAACDGPKETFSYGEAIARLDEMVREAENDRDESGELTEDARIILGQVGEVRAVMHDHLHDHHVKQEEAWHDAWGSCGDWDPPRCYAPTSSMIWLWEIVKTFARTFRRDIV